MSCGTKKKKDCGLSLELFCDTYPYYCKWDNSTPFDEFCKIHKRKCPFIHDTSDVNYMIPVYDGFYTSDRTNTFLDAVGPQKDGDFIDQCSYTHLPNKCNITMIQAAKDGYPYKCFTISSLLGKKNEDSLKLSLSSGINVYLQMNPEDYIDDNDLVQAFVVIHDPRKLVNPMTEGVPLKAGNGYRLHVTMEKKIRLPQPYASKCMDYLNEWEKSGGYGPLSKKDCVYQCIINAMIDDYGCVGQEITYPNNYSICASKQYDTTPEMIKKCHSLCGDACEEESYHFITEVIERYWCQLDDKLCHQRFVDIFVSFKWMAIEKFQLKPKFENIELFSYVGGYLGIWLGLSLVSAFDFVQKVYHSAYPLLKGKRKQKGTATIEKFQLQTV